MANADRTAGTLDARRLEAATVLGEVNLALVSIHQLASDALGNTHAEWYLNAIENLAKVCCRKCDVALGHLGEMPNGNFADEFTISAHRASAEHQGALKG